MFGLGMGELVLILIIALVFIGPKKLPEVAKGLGKGLREFQNATRGIRSQLDDAKRELTQHMEDPSDSGIMNSDEFPMHPHHDNAPSETIAEAVPEINKTVSQSDKKPEPSSHS